MKVLVLGADGYLGWPTCMYFADRGHEVIGVDNYFKRLAVIELDSEPLIAAPALAERARLYKNACIKIHIGDVTDYEFLLAVFKKYTPDAVVHYAEQPSAPYSMIDRKKAAFTLQNNLLSTLNIVYAVKETNTDCHIIKLGTMGEYGTPDIDIEEGWIDIEHNGRKDRFLFPRQASSLYHTTKIQDTDLLWFYVRTWGLRVTDLMQGPVYGIHYDDASIVNEQFFPAFHYDEIFGTVVNRFIVQAVSNHPLTVYGGGGQTRGYINLKDTMQCVYLSAVNPTAGSQLRIYNQITETFSVNELAKRVRKAGQQFGLKVKINKLPNPRIEKEQHYYNPRYTGLQELGLKPHFMTEEVLCEMIETVKRHADDIKIHRILKGIRWS